MPNEEEIFYSIEKLPYRKSWALCRTERSKNKNICEPVAYFTSKENAERTKKELAK